MQFASLCIHILTNLGHFLCRNIKKVSQIFSAEVFLPNYFPPKFLGVNVNVIEKFDGTDGDKDGNRDPVATNLRTKRKETKWMLLLHTVYPYGMNYRICNEFKREQTLPIAKQFPSLIRDKVHNNLVLEINMTLLNYCLLKLHLIYQTQIMISDIYYLHDWQNQQIGNR